MSGFYGVVAVLHLCGWGLYLYYARCTRRFWVWGLPPICSACGTLFDADHIAAVDDTVRYLLEKGKRPLGIGFFFSLGHCTIVLVMALATMFAAAAVQRHLPHWQMLGGLVGAGISGGFLWFIGVLNLFVLLKILRVLARRHGRSARAPSPR